MAKEKAKAAPAGADDVSPFELAPTTEAAAVPAGDSAAPQSDEAKPPPFAVPVTAADGGVPREVKPIERAPAGYSRFKARCDNHEGRKTRYILARAGDWKAAKACFLEVSGLAAQIAHLRTQGVDVADPVVAIHELPD